MQGCESFSKLDVAEILVRCIVMLEIVSRTEEDSGAEREVPSSLLLALMTAIRKTGYERWVSVESVKGSARSVVVLLSAIVVELVVKHVWERCHGREAERTHDLLVFFLGRKGCPDVDILDQDVRIGIGETYDECCEKYADVLKLDQTSGRRRPTRRAQPSMMTLGKFLTWNGRIVVRFKYDLSTGDALAPIGVLWERRDGGNLSLPNVAVELTRWARDYTLASKVAALKSRERTVVSPEEVEAILGPGQVIPYVEGHTQRMYQEGRATVVWDSSDGTLFMVDWFFPWPSGWGARDSGATSCGTPRFSR